MAPDWKSKNHPANRSLQEDLSIDTTFDPSYISWDTPFKVEKKSWWSDATLKRSRNIEGMKSLKLRRPVSSFHFTVNTAGVYAGISIQEQHKVFQFIYM